MDWALTPLFQLGAIGALLGIVGYLARAYVRGTIVSRKTLEDVRADRDARVAEAERQAKEWRELYISEHAAHDTTRRAYADEIRAALQASNEGAQIGVALLTEIRQRQIEARHEPT